MMNDKDGGPAYPGIIPVMGKKWDNNPMIEKIGEYHHKGMSMREYFAGQALAGPLARDLQCLNSVQRNIAAGEDPEANGYLRIMAQIAYAYADAMIKAGEEGK